MGPAYPVNWDTDTCHLPLTTGVLFKLIIYIYIHIPKGEIDNVASFCFIVAPTTNTNQSGGRSNIGPVDPPIYTGKLDESLALRLVPWK